MNDSRTPLFGLLMLVLLVAACSGPRSFDLTPASARETLEEAPRWMFEVPTDDDHLTASATATSRDFQVALDKARGLAQVDVAQQLGARLTNLTRQFQEETGMASDSELLTQFSSATKAITSETLVGAHVVERRVVPEGDVYRAYVLMRLPIGRANELLTQKLRGREALFTRFRATEAYAELDAELQRYEALRAEQN
jgi:AraC-like DNA-binding protein